MSKDDQLPPETVIVPHSDAFLEWREIWVYRELFFFFIWRDIKVKYKQTVLGFGWTILQPLLMMLIFSFFFGRKLDIPSDGIPYPLFVFSGLLLWSIFSNGLTTAGNSMLSQAPIIKKVYFPRIIIPFSAIMTSFFDFALAFMVMVPMLFYYQVMPDLNAIWLWPLSFLVTFVAVLGPSLLFAALTVKYRDFKYLMGFAIQILLFLTPVLYPVSLVQGSVASYLLALNPMFAALSFFRLPLSGDIADILLLSISILSGIFWLVFGFAYFKNTERYFADLA